jgi:dihydropteroate synthase
MIDILDCGGKSLDLRAPQVMGILNVTPDSFSDGGLFISAENALRQARQMVDEGATIIDVGGESTRPGASPVSTVEEIDRVVPIIEAIARELPTVISIDTSKPEVMRAAVVAGAALINDVRALREEGALKTVSELGVPVCLMHMQGAPRSMQQNPHYLDVVSEVKSFLAERVSRCIEAGIPRTRLIIDPGFGFGKTADHNWSLIKHLDSFLDLELPLLVGVSRKSSIGAVTGRAVADRLPGSLALATLACWKGAQIVRAHDVAATVDALKICRAVKNAN